MSLFKLVYMCMCTKACSSHVSGDVYFLITYLDIYMHTESVTMWIAVTLY